MTIQEIIDRFPPKDSRREWWERMQTRINSGEYGAAIIQLGFNDADDDFDEQVIVVVDAIYNHRRNPLNDPGLNPETDR